MNIFKDFRLYFVIVTLSFIGLLVNYMNLKEELGRCKIENGFIQGGDIEKEVLINERDSLKSELFVTEVQLGRYEVAFEMFKEKNRTGAEEFELILTTQTE